MKTPYEILSMPEDASFEQLRERYDELKAKYGEERFLSGEKGAEGARKLTELEDAWSILSARQREKEEEQKYGTGYSAVEALIKERNLDGAQSKLDAITPRDGEWHYYQALIYYKRDWMNDCKTHLSEAVRLDPNNLKYKDALNKLIQKMGNPETPPEQLGGNAGGAQPNVAGNCLSNCCTTLCCLECMMAPFRCCGG